MGGRGSAYIIEKHINNNDNKSSSNVLDFINDPETEYHNEMFKKLKSVGVSTRKSTDGIDDKILSRQQEQIYNICSKYKNILKFTTETQDIQLGAEDIKEYGTLAYCNSMIVNGRTLQRVVIDTKQLKNYDKLLNTVEYGIKNKQFVPINTKFKSRDYLITHEFGHAIENSIFEKVKRNIDLQGNDFVRFRKIYATKIKNEVINICKNKFFNDTIMQEKDINLSKYSGKNEREWFAETFTNLELAEKPAPIALSLQEYLRSFE